MKKAILAIALTFASSAWAQPLTTEQQGTALTHIEEIAGELGLLSIVCPVNEAAPIDAPTLFCFTESFSSADTFRMGWDLFSGEFVATMPALGVAPWALNPDTESVQRTFALPGEVHYTVVFLPERSGGRIWVGAHQPR